MALVAPKPAPIAAVLTHARSSHCTVLRAELARSDEHGVLAEHSSTYDLYFTSDTTHRVAATPSATPPAIAERLAHTRRSSVRLRRSPQRSWQSTSRGNHDGSDHTVQATQPTKGSDSL